MAIDSATKISKNMKEMTVVDTGGGGHELTQDVNDIRNVRMSDAATDKTAECSRKMSVKLHKIVHRALISKTSLIKKIMNILSLGEVVAVRYGCGLYPKKVTKRAQVRHMKLLTEMSLNKDKILIIIPHDEHIIHIEKNKGTTMGGSVSEKSRIILTINKSSSNNNQGEALNLSMRGLPAAIERTAETTYVAIKNRIARRWVHLDLFKNSP
jgi:hypothetical protein